MRVSLLFFLFVYITSAQEVLFEGDIYDSKNHNPIPYVNLSFLNTLKGTSTDENGHFFLDIPTSHLEKKVHISSLGYKDTIVDARILFNSKKIRLIEESYKLDEVVLSENMGDSFVLNPINSHSITSGFSSSHTPWVLALYFPNIGAQNKVVEKATVFFQKTDFRRLTSKFRIRVYDVDPRTQKPRRDLINESIILECDFAQDFVSADLSAFKIKMPEEGIYIGLEWLFIPYNWYKMVEKSPVTNKHIVEDRFAPTFGGVYVNDKNLKAMVYGMGEWIDFKVKSKDKSKNFIPAISLKLSKEKSK
ncbi:hypothetical protein GGR42_001071 [Saonia flava]|uniref:CarboxypepD_reg-like domain-containing protein n=1 Tax=Saonia flava TaxID=523696 RepID=A0A846R177_9FLAO|nr:carboxypeptidase-like regulatory domain-containing protein [Saonia flava]NJB70609.1 hypothetical protein [Saonia flava]